MPKLPKQTDHSNVDEEEEEEEEEEEDSPLKLRKFLEENGNIIAVIIIIMYVCRSWIINSSCGGGHYRGGGPSSALSARWRLGLGGVRCQLPLQYDPRRDRLLLRRPDHSALRLLRLRQGHRVMGGQPTVRCLPHVWARGGGAGQQVRLQARVHCRWRDIDALRCSYEIFQEASLPSPPSPCLSSRWMCRCWCSYTVLSGASASAWSTCLQVDIDTHPSFATELLIVIYSVRCGLLLWEEACPGHGDLSVRLRGGHIRVRAPGNLLAGCLWLEGGKYSFCCPVSPVRCFRGTDETPLGPGPGQWGEWRGGRWRW